MLTTVLLSPQINSTLIQPGLIPFMTTQMNYSEESLNDDGANMNVSSKTHLMK